MPDTGRKIAIVRKAGDAPGAKPDPRVQRTISALLRAFIGLVGERNYRAIGIADIVTRADVGRSTFYDHFRTKDDILLASMGWIFATLADAVDPSTPPAALDNLAAHFWGNRQLGRVVLSPPIEPKLRRALSSAIEARIAALPPAQRPDPASARIAAVRIAAGQLGLMEAWTKGEVQASALEMASAIREAARL